MRYKLTTKSLYKIFTELTECGYTSLDLAKELSKHPRTIRDWKRGKFSIDGRSFDKLLALSGLESTNVSFKEVDETSQKRIAGKRGGKASYKKRGDFGSIDDKRRGGASSYKKLKGVPGSIYSKKAIREPNEAYDLAEFIGVCMGDGSITDYQLTISLNTIDDKDYISYVADCGQTLFGLEAAAFQRKTQSCTNIVFNGVKLVDFLLSKGLPKGDKIRAGLNIPEWISSDPELAKACIRGLFDTDGSIFLETHRINGKEYSYPRMMLVSASEQLRESVCTILNQIGINAKIRMSRSVSIERFTDIEKYFKMIGSSNQKHLDRYAKFGGVG